MAKTQYWYNQKVLFRTHLPAGDWAKGRDYYFMEDVDGTIYIAKVGLDGNPDLS